MAGNDLLHLSTYAPSALLDAVIEKLQLKNDSALAGALDVSRPVISKIRSGTMAVGAIHLIRMHEVSGINIKDLRRLMGDTRRSFSGDCVYHRKGI
ncbi:hypothetical protein BH11PSE11_BH11PSE11_12230 [soil metagenome]